MNKLFKLRLQYVLIALLVTFACLGVGLTLLYIIVMQLHQPQGGWAISECIVAIILMVMTLGAYIPNLRELRNDYNYCKSNLMYESQN